MPTEEQKAEVKARAMKVVLFVRDCFLKLGDTAVAVWNNIRSGKYKKHTQGMGTILFGDQRKNKGQSKVRGQDPFGFGEGNPRQGDTIQDLFSQQPEGRPESKGLEELFGIQPQKTVKKNDDDDYFRRLYGG